MEWYVYIAAILDFNVLNFAYDTCLKELSFSKTHNGYSSVVHPFTAESFIFSNIVMPTVALILRVSVSILAILGYSLIVVSLSPGAKSVFW